MLNIEFRRIAVAAIGALILSSACVGAAIGPATVGAVQAPVTA